MLNSALDFSKDICGHIDVLLSMFIVKKILFMYVISITILIVKLVLTSDMC